MLGFSHRAVLFGAGMLETNTTAVTVSSSSIYYNSFYILSISLHVGYPGTTRLYMLLMLMFYDCEEVHVDVVIGTCLYGRLMMTSIGL